MRRDPWFWRVRAAQRDLIERCGGVRRAAEIAGCSHGWIGKCNSATEDAFLSLPQKRALEADADDPVVTRAEAELAGFALGARPLRPAAPQPSDPFGAHAALIAEVGELLGNFAARVCDGEFSRADGAAIDRDLADVIERAETFRRLIAQHHAACEGGAGRLVVKQPGA